MNITGTTKITGIFGYPVEHTLSPAMHNAAFEALNLDYCYIAFSVHPDLLKDAVRAIQALNLCGANVTIPHKENVIPLLDKIDDEASFIGAVNTIVNADGKLIGYNTDGRGFMQSLSESNIFAEGKDVFIIGAGGASRAISYYLCRKARRLCIYNRNKERAERLAIDLNRFHKNVSTDNLSGIERFHIIINTTPLGLKEGDPLPFDTTPLRSDHVVCDLIYKRTRLLEEASKKGCTTLDGRGMLLWQGVFAFELWTGEKPPVEIMRNALYNRLK